METTGNIHRIQGEIEFEWEIKNFLQLRDKLENGYKSPELYFFGATWVIQIYPYGQKFDETAGYIDLFLAPVSIPKSITIDLSFSFKTIDGKKELVDMDTHNFEDDEGWGPYSFLRSDLIKRRSELLPSGTLTVVCTLKKYNANSDSTKNTFLDASAQTEGRTAECSLDASVQTEEGTGVWKLQQHLNEISLNGDISDVILKVEDQEFKSHRCILAARSPVFSAMMKNKMKENATGIVDIQDFDKKTFSEFLNYLYTGSTKVLTPENVAKLYTAADKYQVEVLKENCLDHMLVNVSTENFCDIFIVSVQHNIEKLKETCIQYFAKHSLDIIKSCKWQSLLSVSPIICNELYIKHLELLNKDICTLHCKACQE